MGGSSPGGPEVEGGCKGPGFRRGGWGLGRQGEGSWIVNSASGGLPSPDPLWSCRPLSHQPRVLQSFLCAYCVPGPGPGAGVPACVKLPGEWESGWGCRKQKENHPAVVRPSFPASLLCARGCSSHYSSLHLLALLCGNSWARCCHAKNCLEMQGFNPDICGFMHSRIH